ncbi:MAG: acyl-CoA desaturase [Myxococcota bacterium]
MVAFDRRTSGPYIDWKKVAWFSGHALVAALCAVEAWSWSATAVFALLSVVTLCLGHSVGVHRLMIHRSFSVSVPVERGLVYLGSLVGMAGPLELLHTHHQRDLMQRATRCHDYFCHQGTLLQDFAYNFFCGFRLHSDALPPVNNRAVDDGFIRFLDTSWRAQQIPVALGLYLIGGWSWVVWGISVRIVVGVFGHWLVAYCCHHGGDRPRIVPGAAVQGSNHLVLGILSFGEGFHNNHHAFPDSAQMGIERWEFDLGWWCVLALEWLGLASGVRRAKTGSP